MFIVGCAAILTSWHLWYAISMPLFAHCCGKVKYRNRKSATAADEFDCSQTCNKSYVHDFFHPHHDKTTRGSFQSLASADSCALRVPKMARQFAQSHCVVRLYTGCKLNRVKATNLQNPENCQQQTVQQNENIYAHLLVLNGCWCRNMIQYSML